MYQNIALLCIENITCYANDVYSRSKLITIPASPVHQ